MYFLGPASHPLVRARTGNTDAPTRDTDTWSGDTNARTGSVSSRCRADVTSAVLRSNAMRTVDSLSWREIITERAG